MSHLFGVEDSLELEEITIQGVLKIVLFAFLMVHHAHKLAVFDLLAWNLNS